MIEKITPTQIQTIPERSKGVAAAVSDGAGFAGELAVTLQSPAVTAQTDAPEKKDKNGCRDTNDSDSSAASTSSKANDEMLRKTPES